MKWDEKLNNSKRLEYKKGINIKKFQITREVTIWGNERSPSTNPQSTSHTHHTLNGKKLKTFSL